MAALKTQRNLKQAGEDAATAWQASQLAQQKNQQQAQAMVISAQKKIINDLKGDNSLAAKKTLLKKYNQQDVKSLNSKGQRKLAAAIIELKNQIAVINKASVQPNNTTTVANNGVVSAA